MTDSNTPASNPSNDKPAGSAEKVARLVTELGVGWARYGLTLGRLALQQSARALETTSEILGEVATKMEKAATTKADGVKTEEHN